MPPHTLITCPDTYEPISEAKNKQQFATSSGFPALLRGMFVSKYLRHLLQGHLSFQFQCSGAIALHRIFLESNFCAIDFVKPIIPDLDAE